MKSFNPKTKRRYSPIYHRLFSLLLFALIPIALIWLNHTYFVIKTVDCRFGTSVDCPDKVLEILKKEQNHSIFRLNQSRLKKEIIATGWGNNPQISFTLPGQLHLYLEPLHSSYPVLGYWQNELPSLSLSSATNSGELSPPSVELDRFLATGSSQPFLLLESGLLIAGQDVSTIHLINKNELGRDYLQLIYSWIKEILYREIKYQALYFVDKQLIIKQNQLPDIVFALAKDPHEQITALQEIIRATTIKDIKVIDFTYNHPILR